MEEIYKYIDNLWQASIKPVFYMLWITLLSLISPIYYVFIALFFMWLFNFFMGMKTDKKVNGKDFSINKAFDSIKQIGFLGMASLMVYFIPYLMGDKWIGIKGINAVTYIVFYFYLTNSFRNATLYWPNKKEIAFIYEVLTTQIFTRLRNTFMLNKDSNL